MADGPHQAARAEARVALDAVRDGWVASPHVV